MIRRRIFIAPLDWGLGHAARMIPLVHRYRNEGHTVLLGGSGLSLNFLSNEFPELETVELPGMNIRYSSGRRQLFTLLLQYPKMRQVVRNENRALQKIIREKKIDLVISDNRYGLFCNDIPCIFITHQLHIRAGLFSKITNQINHRFLKKFSECHIPDHAEFPGLAGNLSHAPVKSLSIKYIGPLSRFTRPVDPSSKKSYRFIAIISGPEPQRSLLEEETRIFFENISAPCVIVRGSHGPADEPKNSKNILLYDNCSTGKLEELLDQSETMIARSGYSTIMDLSVLNIPAVLIPTPGQPEQEYLARLHKNKYKIISQGSLHTLQ